MLSWRKTSPMVVASNTSPISNLVVIGRLSLLRSQFREIWIPGAVQSELHQLSDPAPVEEIQQALQDGWIKPRALREDHIARLLAAGARRAVPCRNRRKRVRPRFALVRLRQFQASEGTGWRAAGLDWLRKVSFAPGFRKQGPQRVPGGACVRTIVFLQLRELRERPRVNCRKPVFEGIGGVT